MNSIKYDNLGSVNAIYKKQCLLAIWTLICCLPSSGQNLVMNPGLDQYINCPSSGQFGSAWINDWDKPSIASSDYFHFNCPGIAPSKQLPRSGEGYAGIICYNLGTEYREYITGTLQSPLTAGAMYAVEFYVSLNDGYIQAIEEVGAYLSASPPGPFGNVLHISVTPQVEHSGSALDDTSSWMMVYGTFTATGGEQYITIGNFNDDANTTITQPGSVGSFGTYYFVDDVSVSPLTSIHDETDELQLTITSTSDDEIIISLWGADFDLETYELRISGVTGSLIHESRIRSSETRVRSGPLNGGIYFVSIHHGQGKILTRKLVIR